MRPIEVAATIPPARPIGAADAAIEKGGQWVESEYSVEIFVSYSNIKTHVLK